MTNFNGISNNSSGELDTKPSLLKLPGELRNKIYTLVLGGTHYRVNRGHRTFVGTMAAETWYRSENDSDLVKKNRLALLRTCRQIYEESKMFHAELSTYHFNDPMSFLCWPGLQPGAKTVVIDCITIVFFLCAKWFSDRVQTVTRGYVYDIATIANVEFKIVVIDADHFPDDFIKREVMKWGLQCLHDTHEKVKVNGFKSGPRFTLSVVHHGEKILTMAE